MNRRTSLALAAAACLPATAHAADDAAAQPAGVLMSLVRQPERESRYRWLGPIARRRLLIYRLTRHAAVRVTRLEGLRGLQDALDQIRRDGRYEKLRREWFG